VFLLPDKPVAALWPTQNDSIHLEVLVAGAPDGEWQRAPDWDRAGPHDRTYVLSPERGEVTFGDGRKGRVPPAGAEVWATYEVGGGPSGNVAAGTLTLLDPAQAGLSITQPAAATGGQAAEDIEEAIGLALAAQAAPGRLVTLQDFEAMALAVPGAPVTRAHAIADYDPAMPCLPALGNVTVVVVPSCPASRPEPSPALLCAVARYLEQHRTLTTELHVVGPCYTVVSVEARLHPTPGANARTLAASARAALNDFLDPLRGGPDHTGWPVGRDVYRAEIMALLNEIPGVSFVDDVVIKVGEGQGARCGNVTVCRHGLIASGTHRITIASGSECP
jgi:predicted phage baseplate assembly protein